MAKLAIFLTFLCVFHGCLARQSQQEEQEQQQRGRCQIQRLNAQEPRLQIKAEAGITEFWDRNDDQFQCAEVALIRHVIQQRGLLLPSYTSSPLLAYVQQGRGFFGLMVPGCPETYQSSQSQSSDRRRRFHDQHQKIGQLRQGDIVAIPQGAAHWVYNEGDQDLVLVVLEDSGNNNNQLDSIPRRFFIAGNPQQAQEEGQQQEQEGRQGRQEWGRGGSGDQPKSGNVFKGIDVETLAEAFNVDQETARKLQSQDDQRGHIVRVDQGLQVLRPPMVQQQEEEQEQQSRGDMNGIEETICTARARQNIDNPSRADVFNPNGGRFTTVNGFTLPILNYIRLSAERGVLYKNAMVAPHWYINAHGVVYATRGQGRIQIVDHRGQAVFDGEVREGQAIVVPMNFAVLKQAGNQGFEWVGFNTNENAMINTLNGRTSALRGLPASVIANAYQISREDAQKLKYNRDETIIFSPGFRSQQQGRRAVE